MNLEERKLLRTQLLRMRFRKVARSPRTATGGYVEQWERTKKGVVTDTVMIEWKTEEKGPT